VREIVGKITPFLFYYVSNYKIINSVGFDTLDRNFRGSLNCTAKKDKENNLKFHHHVIID
jgi:hypothetical protein